MKAAQLKDSKLFPIGIALANCPPFKAIKSQGSQNVVLMIIPTDPQDFDEIGMDRLYRALTIVGFLLGETEGKSGE